MSPRSPAYSVATSGVLPADRRQRRPAGPIVGPWTCDRPSRTALVDVALVLLVLGFSLAEVLGGQVPGPLWAGLVSALGFSLPLLWRRRYPWVVLVVIYGMLVFCVLTGVSTYQYMGSVIGCVVALGTIAAQADLVPSLFALAAAYSVLLLTALRDPGGWLWGLFIVGAVWTVAG